MIKKQTVFVVLLAVFVCAVLLFSEYFGTKAINLFAMDTYCEIEIKGKRKHLENLTEIIDFYDEKYDVYDEESMIFDANKNGEINDKETVELVKTLLSYNKKTDGAYDFSMKKQSDLWGFSKQKLNIPEEINFESFGADKVIATENEVKLEGVELDFGGVMKGYVTDKMAEYLTKNKIKEAVLNLGGNVYAKGSHKIGIQDPEEKDVLCSVEVTDKAVVTAGVYQRFLTDENGRKYHHILNPKTGYPANSGLISVSIIGKSATECDVLATAFLVLGIDKSMEISENFEDIEIIFITDDCIYYTDGLEEKIEFLKETKHEVIK